MYQNIWAAFGRNASSRFVSIIAGVSVALTLANSSRAATLLPGFSLTPPPFGPGALGATLVTSSTVNFAAVSFSGNLVSKVYSNDPNGLPGGLTFTYELNMDPLPGGDSASLLTISSYTGFVTDVSYANGTASAGVVPYRAARNNVGDIIRFVFEDANANPTLAPGVNSALLVVRTDAQAYQSTIAGVINGSTANVATFAPVAIPEPSTAALGITGGAVLLAWVMRRRMN